MVANHAYAVLGFNTDSAIVHVWNPHGDDFTPVGRPGIQAGYHVQDGHFFIPLYEFLQVFMALTYESGLPGRG
jgi:hypothetical protein